MINNRKKEQREETITNILVKCAISAVPDILVFTALGAPQAGVVSAGFKLVLCSANKVTQSYMTPELKSSVGVVMDIIEPALKYGGRTWYGGGTLLKISTAYFTGLSNGFLYKMTDFEIFGTNIEITDSWPKLLALLAVEENGLAEVINQLDESLYGNMRAAAVLGASVNSFVKPALSACEKYENNDISGEEFSMRFTEVGLQAVLIGIIPFVITDLVNSYNEL